MDELVALLDDDGKVCGSAPRSVMRRENLRHGATGVLVRNSAGEIYVHRRTPTKDVYPGHYDFSAGGVVAAGEDPYDAVVRELAEELGITGVELTRLPEGDYADDHTSYHAYLYTCTWDGPIKHQPEEVEWGTWMSPTELITKLDDPSWPFMPDTTALLGPLVRTYASTINDDGWDSRAWLDGEWLHRVPRREEVRPRLLAETRLLSWLAPQLPVPIPLPEPTEYGVRHRVLIGEPLEGGSTALGRELGAFLRALHAVDPAEAVAHGALDAESAAAERMEILDKMRQQVLPLLPDSARGRGVELLDRIAGVHTSLVHGDLGPDHVLVSGGRITGVIDWTDAHVGDPALDLAWILNTDQKALSDGFVETYQPSPVLRSRAYDWYRLGPWYEVGHGIATGQPKLVESGLSGVLARL